MIDDQLLLQTYIDRKKMTRNEMSELGLTIDDFSISLNVSNEWKLHLYKKLFNLKDLSLTKLFSYFSKLVSSEEKDKINSLNIVFKLLKSFFVDFNTDIFPYKPGEIPPFSRKGKFIWGAIYKIYTQGTNRKIIASNLSYIKNKFNSIISTLPNGHLSRNVIDGHFSYNTSKWVLDKYYRYDNINNKYQINYNSFYTETFKFVSNIIQYKIPFYLSFFISIFKLFIKKEKAGLIPEIDQVNIKVLVSYFEDGLISEDYIAMTDFGLPAELISTARDKGISLDHITNKEYDSGIFDKYEELLLDEFTTFIT